MTNKKIWEWFEAEEAADGFYHRYSPKQKAETLKEIRAAARAPSLRAAVDILSDWGNPDYYAALIRRVIRPKILAGKN